MTDPTAAPDAQPGPSSDERTWAMAMHLGTLATYFVGAWFLNLLVPLVVLLWKGGDSTFVADHSREQLNFQISLLIYTIVAVVLALLTLGLGLLVLIPLGLVVAIVAFVVTILAAIAANAGRAYRIPLTIRFIRA